MNNLNSVLIEGVLLKDPEKGVTKKGQEVSNMEIQTARYFKIEDEEIEKEVSRFDIVAYDRLAKICNEFLKKDRGIRVIGRLKLNFQHRVIIVAENIEFTPVRGDGK